MIEPARPLVGIVGQYGADVEEMAYRRAIAEGEFRTDAEFFSIGRTYDELSGTLVATPFDLVDGSVLIVVRGLVPPEAPALRPLATVQPKAQCQSKVRCRPASSQRQSESQIRQTVNSRR